MIPVEFQEVMSSLEFEESGCVAISAFRMEERDVVLNIALQGGDKHDLLERWSIRCRAVRNYEFSDFTTNMLHEELEHVLLWPFKMLQGRLFFNRREACAREVMTMLYGAHDQAVCGWFPFEKFLNPSMFLPELLDVGVGLLAEGPLSLLETYKEVVEEAGMTTTMVGVRHPVRWVDNAWVDEDYDLKALVLGRSFVIAEEFEYSRFG